MQESDVNSQKKSRPQSLLDTVPACKAIFQKCLPHFGIYSFEYEWADLISAYKCNTDFINKEAGMTEDDVEFQQGIKAQMFDNMLQYLPEQFLLHRNDVSEAASDYKKIFKLLDSDLIRHLQPNPAENNAKPDNVDFYILNYSTANLRKKYYDTMKMQKVRINFAPHAFVYQDAEPGANLKQYFRAALYTQWGQDGKKSNEPNLVGVEACNDQGRIAINPSRFISDRTVMEVWLHSSDEANDPMAPMAISPNNGAFLLNLAVPVVNFSIVFLQSPEPPSGMKLSIFNVTFINDMDFADMKLYQNLDQKMLDQALASEQSKDLETGYLSALKQTLQGSIAEKLNDEVYLQSALPEEVFENLYMHEVWVMLDKPNVEDVAGRLVKEVGMQSRISQFRKRWLDQLLFQNVFKTHQAMLAYGKSSMELQDISLQYKIEQAAQGQDVENKEVSGLDSATQNIVKVIKQLETHMEFLFAHHGFDQSITDSFSTLPKCIQDLVCYRTWESFGKIEGVHYDFGRHSYLHLEGEMNEAYYSKPDHRIQTICTLIDQLRLL